MSAVFLTAFPCTPDSIPFDSPAAGESDGSGRLRLCLAGPLRITRVQGGIQGFARTPVFHHFC